MGFWTKFGGYAMMAGGVIAAPYTAGASLALVPAGANMVGNDMKKEGAATAAAAEQAGLDKAITTQEQARDANAAAFTPYTSVGSAAMGALGEYMGLPTLGNVAGKPMTGPAPVMGPAAASPGSRQPSPTAEMTGRVGVPRDAATDATPQTRAIQQNASGYRPTLGGTVGGGLVKMRAPTGETRMVPRDQVAQFQQRGAVLLEGVA